VLDMFPYPSGEGLHVGHPEGYTATDIVSRFERMRGTTVMHPMGFDAFGLPAEEYAIRTGTPPRESTERNIANFTRQLKMLGFSYDWNRALATTDPDYVRWTQWIFLVLFDTWFDAALQKGRPIAELPVPVDVEREGETAVARYRDAHRLAYQSEAPVNWCPALGTVLANEEVIGGVSERGGYPVVRIPLRQWMLRITAYADRLEKDLDQLDWSGSIKLLQRNWIGRSTGGDVDFFIGTTKNPDGMPSQEEFEYCVVDRIENGYPRKPGDDVLHALVHQLVRTDPRTPSQAEANRRRTNGVGRGRRFRSSCLRTALWPHRRTQLLGACHDASGLCADIAGDSSACRRLAICGEARQRVGTRETAHPSTGISRQYLRHCRRGGH